MPIDSQLCNAVCIPFVCTQMQIPSFPSEHRLCTTTQIKRVLLRIVFSGPEAYINSCLGMEHLLPRQKTISQNYFEGGTMSKFMLRDIENLKRAGSSVQDIHYNLANTVLNSDNIAANVRTLDKKTGQFEIVLTGTIDKSVLEREMGGSEQSKR